MAQQLLNHHCTAGICLRKSSFYNGGNNNGKVISWSVIVMLPGVVCSSKWWKVKEGFRWDCLKPVAVVVVPRTKLSLKLVLEKTSNISLERCPSYCPTSCWTWILVGLERTICHTLQPLECDDRDHCSPDWFITPEQHSIISGLPSSGNKSKSPGWVTWFYPYHSFFPHSPLGHGRDISSLSLNIYS